MKTEKNIKKIINFYLHLVPFNRIMIEKTMKSMIPLFKDKAVLDVGCGDGNYSFVASKYAKKVYGIDTNIEILKSALKKNNIEYLWSDATKIRFPNETFDFIFCNSVLEHIENDKKAVDEMRRVLRKNGFLFIGVPHKKFLTYSLKKKEMHGHKRFGYDMKEIRKIAKGFKIVTFWYQNRKILSYLQDLYFVQPSFIRYALSPLFSFIALLFKPLDNLERGQGSYLCILLQKVAL